MIVDQVYVFMWSVVVGIILTFIFDIFRALRRSFDTRNIWVYIQDFLFWIIVGVVIIISAFITNFGDIRGYMIIGYAIGCGLYLLVLSRYVLMVLTKIFVFVRNCFRKPFEFIIKYLKKIKFKSKNIQKIAGK